MKNNDNLGKCITLTSDEQKNTLLKKLISEHSLAATAYRFDPYKTFKFRLMFNEKLEKSLVENGFKLEDCTWD